MFAPLGDVLRQKRRTLQAKNAMAKTLERNVGLERWTTLGDHRGRRTHIDPILGALLETRAWRINAVRKVDAMDTRWHLRAQLVEHALDAFASIEPVHSAKIQSRISGYLDFSHTRIIVGIRRTSTICRAASVVGGSVPPPCFVHQPCALRVGIPPCSGQT